MAERAFNDAEMLAGLVLPAKRHGKTGRMGEQERLLFLDATEQLLSRGVERPFTLSRLLGVTPTAAKALLKSVRDGWSESMPQALLNTRREHLYREAAEVSRLAWEAALVAESPTIKLNFLRAVLEANKRKASLIGLDHLTLDIDARLDTSQSVDVVQRVEKQFSLAPGALEELGKSAALWLSHPVETEDVGEIIDVHPTFLSPENGLEKTSDSE